jgi:hypothetical protein
MYVIAHAWINVYLYVCVLTHLFWNGKFSEWARVRSLYYFYPSEIRLYTQRVEKSGYSQNPVNGAEYCLGN